MRLAGLKFLIGDYLYIHIPPGVGLSITLFFVLWALTLTYPSKFPNQLHA
jgi:hypothetical protein